MATFQILGESTDIEKFKIHCSECGSENCQVQAVISEYVANCIVITCLECKVDENVYDEVKEEPLLLGELYA